MPPLWDPLVVLNIAADNKCLGHLIRDPASTCKKLLSAHNTAEKHRYLDLLAHCSPQNVTVEHFWLLLGVGLCKTHARQAEEIARGYMQVVEGVLAARPTGVGVQETGAQVGGGDKDDGEAAESSTEPPPPTQGTQLAGELDAMDIDSPPSSQPEPEPEPELTPAQQIIRELRRLDHVMELPHDPYEHLWRNPAPANQQNQDAGQIMDGNPSNALSETDSVGPFAVPSSPIPFSAGELSPRPPPSPSSSGDTTMEARLRPRPSPPQRRAPVPQPAGSPPPAPASTRAARSRRSILAGLPPRPRNLPSVFDQPGGSRNLRKRLFRGPSVEVSIEDMYAHMRATEAHAQRVQQETRERIAAAREAEMRAAEQIRTVRERFRTAEERARVAEEQARITEEQARIAEGQARIAAEHVRMAAERAHYAGQEASAAEEQARNAEAEARAAQLQADEQDRKAKEEARKAVDRLRRKLRKPAYQTQLQQRCETHVPRRPFTEECTVCQEPMDGSDPGNLWWCMAGCGNSFHTACISEWLKEHPTCGLCRHPWSHELCACHPLLARFK
ncbi:hypothetical protein BU26DRAFT_506706 [Trematosphaeria pertusa]|uniref:RING-type domain-containing protein n=1 Tax=Trematosphaeria pertusa TaxID=390896 RepID=A0A6A6IA88_9PLEO|nr:uncharacterized protein BU26DRAFT_506706 [Trematosphaeria pertusa]KAF2247475.1 hypothetical protein BU26DRAFT_506706 [Trematosphaeria pertusa]